MNAGSSTQGLNLVHVEAAADAAQAAVCGAALLARWILEAIAARGRALIAVSGGRTPWAMLAKLAAEPLPWDQLHVFQVDERWAEAGDPARNLTQLRSSLPKQARLYPMPVDEYPDPEAAASAYAATLAAQCGAPVILDVVHLGVGADGHTASLVPGDPVLEVSDRDVAATGVYQGHRRLTLTFPALSRARNVLWLASGPAKAHAVQALLHGDLSIPAARIRAPQQILVADRAALGQQ